MNLCMHSIQHLNQKWIVTQQSWGFSPIIKEQVKVIFGVNRQKIGGISNIKTITHGHGCAMMIWAISYESYNMTEKIFDIFFLNRDIYFAHPWFDYNDRLKFKEWVVSDGYKKLSNTLDQNGCICIGHMSYLFHSHFRVIFESTS